MATTSITVSMPAGSAVTLHVPTDLATGDGYFPLETETGKVVINGQLRDLILGFAVEFEDVGELSPIPESQATGELKVKYTHNKSNENRIHFFSATGEEQVVSIVTIPIHDHSSVVQGGPAYGTYYSLYKPEDVETPQN